MKDREERAQTVLIAVAPRWDLTTIWFIHLTVGKIIFLNCHLSLHLVSRSSSPNRKPSFLWWTLPPVWMPLVCAGSDPHPLFLVDRLNSNLKRSRRKEPRESLVRPSLILRWSQAISVRLNPLMVTRSRVRNACWHSTTAPLTMVRRAMIFL